MDQKVTYLDLAPLEAVPRPIVARRGEYPAGDVILPHEHRRSQLLCALSGVAIVATEHNRWLVPPDHALWIPAGTRHSVEAIERLTTGSIYVEPEALSARPARSHVVRMTELMKSLIVEAVRQPPEYDPQSRAGLIMALIMAELPLLPDMPLSLPLPHEPRLAALCRKFLSAPSAHETIDNWAAAMAMSRSAFTRAFRRETGLSVLEWRQQACLLAALPRLVAGEKVSAIAYDLGYESAAAFTTMFKRVTGMPPRQYLCASGTRSDNRGNAPGTAPDTSI
ncbi:MAG: AraC family transcriptional regulator [Rhizobiaceae bacterium]|nr:MAG: AraC family transcriptional regulator [Rhizobiaceae bacterium]